MRVVLALVMALAPLCGRAVEVRPLTAEVEVTPGFLDATRATVVSFLREHKQGRAAFDTVLTERPAGFDGLELGGRLVAFKPGNAAVRAVVGLGSGRASARFEFVLTDMASGKVVWRGTVKAVAAFFGSSGSSHGQRQELPERVAERLVRQLGTWREK